MSSPRPFLLMLGVAQVFVWAGFYYLFPALMLFWESDLGWSRAELALVFSLAVGASALASPIAGWVIDSGGGRWLLCASAAAGGLLLCLLPFVATRELFLVLWLLVGIAMAGCLYEPCFAIIVRSMGEGAQRGITIVTLIAGFASTLAFPAATAIATLAGWRWAVGAAGLAILAVAVPLFWMGAGWMDRPAAAPSVRPPPAAAPMRSIIVRPALWLLAAAFSCFALVHAAVLNHLLPILAEHGISAEAAVLAASMLGPMQVAGRLAMMAVEPHVSAIRLTGWIFVGLGTASLLLLASAQVQVLLVAFVVLQGASVGLSSILKPIVTARLFGRESFGAVTGLMAMPFLAAFAFAPLFGALVWSAAGYDALLWVAFALSGLGYVCFWLAAMQGRSRSR